MATSGSDEERDEEREYLEAEEMSEDVTERLFSELRGINDAEVRIYAKDPDSQKLDYLFSTTGDAFTSITELYDQLRDEYDGGVFRIHVRKGGKMYRNEEIRVRPPKRRGIPDIAPASLTADTGGGGEIVNALAAVLERSNEQNREFMRMMIDTLKSTTPAPAADPAAMSKSVLEGLVQMKELVGGGSGGGNDIDTFLRAAEFVRDLGGNAGEANGWDALKASITGLAPMLMQGMAAMPGMPAAAPPGALPAPAPEALPAPVMPGGPSAPAELQKRFEEVFPLCVEAAQRNSDPGVYAVVVIDRLGPEVSVNMLCQPGQLDTMLAQAPQLQPWRGWFDELVVHILEEARLVHEESGQITNPNATDGDPAGAGGDPSDASSDGVDGQASTD